MICLCCYLPAAGCHNQSRRQVACLSLHTDCSEAYVRIKMDMRRIYLAFAIWPHTWLFSLFNDNSCILPFVVCDCCCFCCCILTATCPRKRLVVCYNGILQYPVIYPATSYKLQASALNSQLWSFVFLLQHIHTYVYDWYVRKCVWFKCMWHTCADISSISQVNPFDNDRSWSGDQCQLLSCS